MTPPAALAYQPESLMEVHSELLGTVDVAESDLIRFPYGLFGFPDCHRFVVLSAEREGFFWLQSADESALVFLLADPFVLFPGYSVDLGGYELAQLDGNERSEILVLAIVTLPQSVDEMPTANLQGPLAINLERGIGRQLAIEHSEFGVRCPFAIPPSAE